MVLSPSILDLTCSYIVAASKCQQFTVVEQMTRESNHLNVDKVVGYLMDAKLADSRPLINVCDRFDRVTELTRFLYENNLLRYIEAYVQKVNPSKSPQVVGGLLDCQADEEFISALIMSVRLYPSFRWLCVECTCCEVCWLPFAITVTA
jgi:clathrin heavy chain